MDLKPIYNAKAQRKKFASAEAFRAYRRKQKEQELKEQAERVMWHNWQEEEEMKRLINPSYRGYEF
jgi:hypothetical protein